MYPVVPGAQSEKRTGGARIQSPGLQTKSSLGGPGHMLQPSGLGGEQMKPGAQPNVRSEVGDNGAKLPGGAGQSFTLKLAQSSESPRSPHAGNSLSLR